jgi:hypothetical protein
MPEFGRLEASALTAAPGGGGDAPAPWTLEGVTTHTVTFEVDRDPALDLLPEPLARPTPPYARIQVTSVPDSPVGPYREAQLLLSCRMMMTPRQYVVAAVVDSEAAAQAIAAAWAYEPAVGEVALSEDGNDFTSTIAAGSGPGITIASHDALPTGTAIIRVDPIVFAWQNGGEPSVQTLSAEPSAVHEAWLARDTSVTYEGGDRSSPWLRLRSRNVITATVAKLDLERPEPSEVERPAGVGGGLP